MAAALVRLLKDPALRKRLGDAGHAYVADNFGVARLLEGTLAAYRKISAKVRARSTRPGASALGHCHGDASVRNIRLRRAARRADRDGRLDVESVGARPGAGDRRQARARTGWWDSSPLLSIEDAGLNRTQDLSVPSFSAAA